MPYDKSLDDQVFSKSWDSDFTRITVSVFSYNNGPKKVQISRENKDNAGNYRFAKLGRMAKDELENILPFLSEAIEQM